MDSIRIQGYKSIKDATIALKPINILIGGNGSGKSNFLSFFEFLNKLYERNLQVYVALKGIEKFLHKGRDTTSGISGRIDFELGFVEFELKAGDKGFIVEKELIQPKEGMSITIGDGYKSTESQVISTFDKFYKKENVQIRGGGILDIKKYHFHDTGRNSPFNRTNNIQNDSYYLYEDGGNIAAMLFIIRDKHPLIYKRIINTIRSISPYFLDFHFEPNENNLMHLQWRDKYSSILYGATDLSDGTIRFIALTVLFMQPKLPATIIIDEPELGLHPQAIGMLAGMMQSAADRGAQIIAATQSVELIDDFQADDVIAVDLVDGESVYTRLDTENLSNWLENYTLGDLWKRNVIGKGQP